MRHLWSAGIALALVLVACGDGGNSSRYSPPDVAAPDAGGEPPVREALTEEPETSYGAVADYEPPVRVSLTNEPETGLENEAVQPLSAAVPQSRGDAGAAVPQDAAEELPEELDAGETSVEVETDAGEEPDATPDAALEEEEEVEEFEPGTCEYHCAAAARTCQDEYLETPVCMDVCEEGLEIDSTTTEHKFEAFLNCLALWDEEDREEFYVCKAYPSIIQNSGDNFVLYEDPYGTCAEVGITL